MSTIRPGRPGRLNASPAPAAVRNARSWHSGDGAEAWLIKAAAQGAQRVRRKMAEAVDLAKLHGTEQVERRIEDVRRGGPVR